MTGGASIPTDEVPSTIVDRECVYLWPDNDRDGLDSMNRIAARLISIGACEVRIVRWADAPSKGDAANFVAVGGTAEDVRQLLLQAERWTSRTANNGEDCLDSQKQEDGLGDTIRPRVDAAGAGATRIITATLPAGESEQLPTRADRW